MTNFATVDQSACVVFIPKGLSCVQVTSNIADAELADEIARGLQDRGDFIVGVCTSEQLVEWVTDGILRWQRRKEQNEDSTDVRLVRPVGRSVLGSQEQSAVSVPVSDARPADSVLTTDSPQTDAEEQVRECQRGKGDPPMDCDAPFCGCNPAWTQALDAAQESGWKTDREVSTLLATIERLTADLAAAKAERDAAVKVIEAIVEETDNTESSEEESLRKCETLARDFLAKRDAVVWLIERGQAQGQSPSVWWTGDAWTLEAIRAKRFSSKVECEQYATGNALLTGIDSVHPRTWQATEHIFVAEARDFLSKREGK